MPDPDPEPSAPLTPVGPLAPGSVSLRLYPHNELPATEIVDRLSIVALEGVAAHIDKARKERRMIHAVGDGTFVVDGRRIDRREAMASKLPGGV